MNKSDDLLKSLLALYRKLRSQIREKWNRDLPFDEIVFDRWERASNLGFGKGSSIYHNSYVYGDVSVGTNTWIGPYTLLDGSGGLQIGRNCSISAGAHALTHDTVKWAVSGGKAEYEYAPVIIGDCCFIGTHAIITKGITIGNHCVISAGCVVTKDVPDFSIVAGVPSRVIGHVIVSENDKITFNYDKKKKV